MFSQKSKILAPTLVASALIALFHILALEYFWYWVYWWFDIPMHIVGGFIIGMLVFLFVYPSSPVKALLFVIGAVLTVGVGWEVFEYINGMFIEGTFFPDTYHDIFADCAGALLAYLYVLIVRYPHVMQNYRDER